MEKDHMIVRKRVKGEVQYNDGEFAEIQIIGIEGIEEDLLLETIQIHPHDAQSTPGEFQSRFPVGMGLGILTTIEITRKRGRRSLQTNSASPVKCGQEPTPLA